MPKSTGEFLACWDNCEGGGQTEEMVNIFNSSTRPKNWLYTSAQEIPNHLNISHHNLMFFWKLVTCIHQQKTIAEHWTPQGWSFIFGRQLNNWEIQRVADFFSIIDQFNGLEVGQDTLRWKGSKKGLFKRTVVEDVLKSQRHILDYAWQDYWSNPELGGSREQHAEDQAILSFETMFLV
ncbi:hypothetical protein H5410_009871 [Solanum commersonii]|uniref:Uncharacterized protein n=1 Tax=Solanum commersonii TaxID=4109 RepID=A0A9J6AJ55_SOLCO|nr:hypothetical protein H5410_009871 [Solanum commersonii]